MLQVARWRCELMECWRCSEAARVVDVNRDDVVSDQQRPVSQHERRRETHVSHAPAGHVITAHSSLAALHTVTRLLTRS